MPLYCTEVTIVATAYIIADNQEQAQALIQTQLVDAELLVLPDGQTVDGRPFAQMLENTKPRCTLSPAMTILGPRKGNSDLEKVHD